MNTDFRLGTDIIEIKRIEEALVKNNSFQKRVYTPSEIAYCESKKKNNNASYAGIYSAKEAFIKALGTGLRYGSWQDIEIGHEEEGAPIIKLKGKFLEVLNERNYKIASLSISHCKEYATSQVLLVAKK